jgi:GNAT superfamily N-acetyltransferase
MSSLRPARPDDAAILAAIAEAAYRHYVPRIGRPPGPMLADYDAVLAGSEVWVAEHDDRPGGFVVLRTAPDHLLIENVAVYPDHQGRGIGTALLDWPASHTASASKTGLSCWPVSVGYAAGMFVASTAPHRHLTWINTMIFIQLVDWVTTLFYLSTGDLTFRQVSTASFLPVVFITPLLWWHPRRGGARA